MEAGPEVLEHFLRCHICSKTFTDPVSLECNHSFCKLCICGFWGQDEDRKCPICGAPASKEEPKVQTTLKGLADVFAGRIKENSIPELQPVEMCGCSVKSMWLCQSEKDKLACKECENVEFEHAGHRLVPLESAVLDMKRSICLDLTPMARQAQDCKEMEEAYVEMGKLLEVQQEEVEKKIKEEFEEIHEFLRKEKEARLATVKEEPEMKRKIIERELKIVRGQLQVLKKAIGHVEVDLKQEPGPFYLEHKRILARTKCRLQDPHMAPGLMINLPKHVGNLKYKVLQSMADWVIYHPVLLDPNTADGWLRVSNDFTTVREVRSKLNVPDNTERFTKYIYLLGSEGYTSGKHCWEVVVSGRKNWSLGVANETVERKGETYLESRFGFWTIWMDEDICTVGGFDIELQKKPDKVRVQLDYDKGELYFYNAADMSYIHAYRTTFYQKIYPFFSTETEDSESGILICPMNLSLITVP